MKTSYPSCVMPEALRVRRPTPDLTRGCAFWQCGCALTALAASAALCAQETTRGPDPVFQPSPAFRSLADYLQVHTGLTYTDNVLQTAANKKAEALASAGFDVDYTHKGSEFEFDSRGAVNWVEYLENTYPGVASGALNAKALLGNSNDWLQWAAWESFGQLNTDPLAAPTPVNVENVNYATTGPLLNLSLGDKNRLSLRGLYSISTYQKSPYDSRSFDAGASLSHAVSTASSISLDVDARRTDFRELAVAADYDIRSAFLGYTTSIARARFSAEAGYTSLHFHGKSSGSPLLSLGLDRRISTSSTIYLEGQVGYSADAESVRTAAGLVAPSAAFAAASSPNPIKQETVSIGWDFERPRTAATVFSSYTRQRYERQASLDQNNVSLQLLVLRRLSPTLAATLTLRREIQKYPGLEADVSQSAVIAGFSKTFTRVGLSLRYQWFRRGGSDSSSGLVGVYHENRVGLYLTYDLLGYQLTPNGLVER